jgi:hypothetical protein
MSQLTQLEKRAYNDGYDCGKNNNQNPAKLWLMTPHLLQEWLKGFKAGTHDLINQKKEMFSVSAGNG